MCGGRGSSARERLKDYLVRKEISVFYAEDVWSGLARLKDLSALEVEAKLTEFADLVIIVVESPGTFAELGAFSLSDQLRKKLLPVMDARYRKDESFLNTGGLASIFWLLTARVAESVEPCPHGPLRSRQLLVLNHVPGCLTPTPSLGAYHGTQTRNRGSY